MKTANCQLTNLKKTRKTSSTISYRTQMENDFFISEASEQDKSKINEIIQKSFQRFFRYFAVHSLNLNGRILVSRKNQTSVGFSKLIWFKVDGRQFSCILWLAVHPDFRGRGIAASLVNAGTEYLKAHDAEAVFASVQRSNFASLATFKKEGFIHMGFRGLWKLFGWRVFSLYRKIWFVPGEFVLMHS